MSSDISRRGAILTGLAALAAPAQTEKNKLKIVIAGAHPDDPETGAGGTAARYSQAGHEVTCLYLTRGEAGIRGKSHEEAGRIRTAEAEQACKLLGARAVFAGQVDGAAMVDAGRYDSFFHVLDELHPDLVFTHFPIDTHRDHRAISMLVYDAWQRSPRKFQLYYVRGNVGRADAEFSSHQLRRHHVDGTVEAQGVLRPPEPAPGGVLHLPREDEPVPRDGMRGSTRGVVRVVCRERPRRWLDSRPVRITARRVCGESTTSRIRTRRGTR